MMKKYPPFYFLAAASYFSALISLFLSNLMFLASMFFDGGDRELLLMTVILTVKNPIFLTLTFPWWWTMICYWRGKFTYLGISLLSIGLVYYLSILIKVMFLSFRLSMVLHIAAWSAGALGALILPIILQFYLKGSILEKPTKIICFIINILSVITIAYLMFLMFSFQFR